MAGTIQGLEPLDTSIPLFRYVELACKMRIMIRDAYSKARWRAIVRGIIVSSWPYGFFLRMYWRDLHLAGQKPQQVLRSEQ